MTGSRVLVVEDQVGDLIWLLDFIRIRGYEVVVVTNEDAARRRLEAIAQKTESYSLAIIDVMVATKDLRDLVALDDQFFEDSRDTGIRLCRYAREALGLSAHDLPITCLTVRDDPEVKECMRELGIPLFNRVPQSPSESIRTFIEAVLPPVEV